MNAENLKRMLFGAVALCIFLAAALAYTLLHRFGHAYAQDSSEPVIASGPATQGTSTGPQMATSSSSEPALAPIQITPQRMQEIGITTATVQMKDINNEMEVSGSVAINEQRISYVQTRFPGWIRNVFANATYQYVKKGQRLFTIYSPDLVSTEQEYLLAKQNQTTSSVHMHGTAADESKWLLQAAEERLRRFDIPETEIAAIEQSGTAKREIPVESPASGFIIERNALPNAYVQPETKLYTIADLSSVWVYANIPQSDAGRLKPGNPAKVTIDAYPGRTFNGRVDQILPELDVATRTVRARLIFNNPGTVLKPGMYVNVTIASPLGHQLVIPSSGVLQSGTQQIAFIDRGQGSLEPVRIETGPRVDDSIVVLKGLKAGDHIVSSANFLVDSEAQLQGSMGGFAPPQPQATPSTSGQNQTSEQLTLEFATEPNPPQKGNNTLHVKLSGANGAAISGAQVSVTFFMPAMPEMGMAAMHVNAKLAEKGNGLYEGTAQLPSGGTWKVNINAVHNGQTTSKRLSVNAAGGM